jgi:glycosyltransferase involved in cell wall biosynthesis
MRITAHNGARIYGGAERATVRLLRVLSDRGHDVTLLCNDEIVAREARARGVDAIMAPIGGDIAMPHALRLAAQLRRLQPDAFIIGTFRKLFLASLGAQLARVPRVVARVGLETDTPRSAKYRIALRRWVDGVAVNAERMIDPFASLEGFGPGKVRLIHNGVRAPTPTGDADLLRKQLGIAPEAFVVGTVCRLVSQKRIDRLVEAMALVSSSVHCMIAGDGDRRAALAAQISALGLGRRVHLLGHRDDVGNVLRALDLYVVSSDREGLSNSMLEAMAAGLPLVSTPVSGASDALGGSHPSGIITRFDEQSIARAIEELNINRSRLKEMGMAARHRAETVFSMDRMASEWEAFLAGANAQ